MTYEETLAMLEQAKMKPIEAKERLDGLRRKLLRDDAFVIDDELAGEIEGALKEYEDACVEYRELTGNIPEINARLEYSDSVPARMKKYTEDTRQMMVHSRNRYLRMLTSEESFSADQFYEEAKDSYQKNRDLYLKRFRWMNGREPTASEVSAPTPYD